MDGTSRVSKRWLRRVAIVTVAGLSSGGLLVLEHVGTGGATGQPSQPKAHTSAPAAHSKAHTSAPAAHSKAHTSKSKAHKSKSVPRHCNDGRGKDGEKNKHCRPPSGV